MKRNVVNIYYGFLNFVVTLLIILNVVSCTTNKLNKISNSIVKEKTNNSSLGANIEGPKIYGVKSQGTCEGCIRGAYSHPDENNNIEKNVYYLEPQTDFNLINTTFDFPVKYNNVTKKWIEYFIGKGRDNLLHYLELSGRYAPFMSEMLQERSMPRDLIFLAMAESGFQNQARSHARAVGPWQFINATGKKFGLKIDWYVDERRDPIKSTIAASTYLRDLFKMFGSWELAAAAYNAGEGKVSRAVRKFASDDFWKISKNRFLKRETRNYVPKIMALAIIGKNLKSFGLEAIEFKDSLEFETVVVPPLTDLVSLSENTGWELENLQMWNPELMRWFTPPHVTYNLRTPVGFSSKVSEYINNHPGGNDNFQKVLITSRTSIKELGKKYRIPADVIMDINEQNSDRNSFSKGDQINIPFRVGQHGKERMYADLYEKVRSRSSRRNFYDHIANAKRKGPLNINPSQYYTVKYGDTLWDVSKKTGVPLENLIRANLRTVENGLKPGTKLAVK